MVCEPITKLKASGSVDQIKDRLYVMTTDNIYTFALKKRTRMYRIKDVGAILQSN